MREKEKELRIKGLGDSYNNGIPFISIFHPPTSVPMKVGLM